MAARAQPKSTAAALDDEQEELIEVGTMAALAALPSFLARDLDPQQAVMQAWAVAAGFVEARARWIDALAELLDEQQD